MCTALGPRAPDAPCRTSYKEPIVQNYDVENHDAIEPLTYDVENHSLIIGHLDDQTVLRRFSSKPVVLLKEHLCCTHFAALRAQSKQEEVNVVTAGGNYGWSVMEGTGMNTDHPLSLNPKSPLGGNYTKPVLEYPHPADPGQFRAVVGGYVYRATSDPCLQVSSMPTLCP